MASPGSWCFFLTIVAIALFLVATPVNAARVGGPDGEIVPQVRNGIHATEEWLSIDGVMLPPESAGSFLDVAGVPIADDFPGTAYAHKIAAVSGPACDEPSTFRKLIRLMVPASTVAATAIGYLMWELRKAKETLGLRCVSAEVAFVVGCYFALVDHIIFSLVIPDSYDLTVALLPPMHEGSALYSGVVVGSFKAGTAVGAICTYVLLRYSSGFWRHRYRQVLLVCAVVNLVGTALYAAVAFAAKSPQEGSVGAKRHLIEVLIFGRVVGGLSAGVRLMLVRTVLGRLSRHEDRPALLCRLVFSLTLGIVVGPFVSSGVKVLYSCHVLSSQCFEAVGFAGVALSLSQIGATIAIRPIDACRDVLAEEEQTAHDGGLNAMEVARRRSIVLHCLFFTLCRSIWFTGLEAATAMILEEHYGWHSKFVGLGIGAAFLVVVPIRTWYQVDRNRFPTVGWMKRGLCVAMLGSLVLFPHLQWLHAGHDPMQHTHAASAVLLTGNALLFSSFLSDGLSQGIICQNLLPQELSVFNLDSMSLMIMALKIGVGRPLGPHFTRFLVTIGGQNLFALSQVLFAALAFFTASSLEQVLGHSGLKKATGLLRHSIGPDPIRPA